MTQNQKTLLERFVKRLKHEITCEMNELERTAKKEILKNDVKLEEFQWKPVMLRERKSAIKHIRDNVINDAFEDFKHELHNNK